MQLKITKITEGLGIGTGSISAESIIGQAGQSTVAKVDAAINSDAIIVPLDYDENDEVIDDDGCGDGRFTKVVMRGEEILKRSLRRAKVFGGGVTMCAADLIGSGKTRGYPMQQTFEESIEALTARNINFGAHTAEHTPEGRCGCGAIDESPRAVMYAARFRDDITAQFAVLGVSTEGLSKVFDNFAQYSAEISDEPFAGSEVIQKILSTKKVVKQLGGPHIEARIVLNFVRGYTVDQQLTRSVSDGKVDVFGVDVWRMQDIAHGLHPQSETAELRAFQCMLAYTLATAAVLTKGDLPVYIVKSKVPQPQGVLPA